LLLNYLDLSISEGVFNGYNWSFDSNVSKFYPFVSNKIGLTELSGVPWEERFDFLKKSIGKCLLALLDKAFVIMIFFFSLKGLTKN